MEYIQIGIISCIILATYSYLFYPLFLAIFRIFVRKTVNKGDITPRISILICAYNEEQKIRNKIENTLSLDYPEELCQIIIASDCSTDKTDSIIGEYSRIQLVRSPERKGKEHALKLAMAAANGDIMVFSDVATIIDKQALSLLVKNFNDPSIGAVSSTDKFLTESGVPAGEGIYVQYEMLLRKLETQINGLVGVSGSFFAARKEVCEDWADDLASDFNTVLNAVRLGYRAVLDTEVIGYYPDLKAGQSEFPRKVRTVIAGITVFFRTLTLLNVFKYGLYSWQIFSHKLMRWLVPFFLIISLFLSVAGTVKGDMFSIVVLYIEILFFSAGYLGQLQVKMQRLLFIKIPCYFMEANTAILVAWFRYLSGKRIKMWEPSKR